MLLKDPTFMEYIERNRAEEEEHFCRHDLQHSIDVARIAYILVLEHQDLAYFVEFNNLRDKLAAKEVIYAAGLLHDIAKWKEYQEGVDHAVFGSRLSREILARAGFDENEISIIVQAIFEHRNISRDTSFLGEHLHRADNLSRVCWECPERDDCVKYKNREMETAILIY